MTQHRNDSADVLTTRQVAELLGMNIQVVRAYAREGRLPAYKLPGGRRFRYFRSEVLAYVRSHPVHPTNR